MKNSIAHLHDTDQEFTAQANGKHCIKVDGRSSWSIHNPEYLSSGNSVTKIFVIRVKELEPATQPSLV